MLITKIRKVLGYILFALVLQYILAGCKETPKYNYHLFADYDGNVTRVRVDSSNDYIKGQIKNGKHFCWADENDKSILLTELRELGHEYMLSPTTKSFERGEDYVLFYSIYRHPETHIRWEVVRFAAKEYSRGIASEALLHKLGYDTRLFTLNDLDNPYDKEISIFSEILTNSDTQEYRDSLYTCNKPHEGLGKQ